MGIKWLIVYLCRFGKRGFNRNTTPVSPTDRRRGGLCCNAVSLWTQVNVIGVDLDNRNTPLPLEACGPVDSVLAYCLFLVSGCTEQNVTPGWSFAHHALAFRTMRVLTDFAHFLSATQLKSKARDRPESAEMSEQWKHQIRLSKHPSAAPSLLSFMKPHGLLCPQLREAEYLLPLTHTHLPNSPPAPLSKHLWCGGTQPPDLLSLLFFSPPAPWQLAKMWKTPG